MVSVASLFVTFLRDFLAGSRYSTTARTHIRIHSRAHMHPIIMSLLFLETVSSKKLSRAAKHKPMIITKTYFPGRMANIIVSTINAAAVIICRKNNTRRAILRYFSSRLLPFLFLEFMTLLLRIYPNPREKGIFIIVVIISSKMQCIK